MLGISYKEHLTEKVDGTIPMTYEETGHQAQVKKAGKPGFRLRAITVKTAYHKEEAEKWKRARGREEWRGTDGHGAMSPTGKSQKRMWRRQGKF